MKRFLSWLTLVGCYLGFYIIIYLDLELMDYIFDLYDRLSAFLKIIVLLVGGSTITGIALTPLFYGIPLSCGASEAVCPSRNGDRYIIWGVLICAVSIFGLISDIELSHILSAIYGIGIIVFGRTHSPT